MLLLFDHHILSTGPVVRVRAQRGKARVEPLEQRTLLSVSPLQAGPGSTGNAGSSGNTLVTALESAFSGSVMFFGAAPGGATVSGADNGADQATRRAHAKLHLDGEGSDGAFNGTFRVDGFGSYAFN